MHVYPRAPVLAAALTSFANIAIRSRVRDDDAIDQLNHWATSGLLLTLALGKYSFDIHMTFHLYSLDS